MPASPNWLSGMVFGPGAIGSVTEKPSFTAPFATDASNVTLLPQHGTLLLVSHCEVAPEVTQTSFPRTGVLPPLGKSNGMGMSPAVPFGVAYSGALEVPVLAG